MKKFLTVIVLLLVVLAALVEFVVPKTLEGVLKDRLALATEAQEITVDLQSTPSAKISFGEIDAMHCAIGAGRIGNLDVKTMSLDGENVRLDIPEILFPNKELSDRERSERYLKHAGKLELRGVVDENGLKAFLEKRVERLKNLEVKMTPNEIEATANLKIMGREADVELAGKIIADGGDLYFQMSRLNIKNSLLRNFQLDRFFGDFKIVDRERLPMNLEFDEVTMRDGEVLMTAVRRK